LGILKLVLGVLVVNHFVACSWYAVGISRVDDDHNWVRVMIERWKIDSAEPDPHWSYSYLTSLHFALSQFTPASMEVAPTNEAERLFAICVIVMSSAALFDGGQHREFCDENSPMQH